MYKEAHQVAKKIALKAGALSLKYCDKLEVAVQKHALDIATNADLAVEDLIVSEIKKVYPEHNFFTEEKNTLDQNSKYTWVIDPIDGTKNYFRQLPFFCNAIALKEDEEVVLGIVYNPRTGEMFSAYKGGGAFLNEKKLAVAHETDLTKAFLYVEWPNSTRGKEEYERMNNLLQKLQPCCYRMRSVGSAELGLAYVAQGAFDAYVDLTNTTKEWDWAAGSCLITEAGAVYRELANGTRLGGNAELLDKIEMILRI